jgi:hypothetical protein
MAAIHQERSKEAKMRIDSPGTKPPLWRRAGLGLLAAVGLTALPIVTAAASPAATPVNISASCGASNAEVESAVAPAKQYVFDAWIGCAQQGIGFARSTDGGKTFGRPVIMPDSYQFVWDPAVAVAPDGAVYVSFMTELNLQMFPVVDVSFDHGATFPRSTMLEPTQAQNWGDRVFIAAGPNGTVYLTWDYGPSRKDVTFSCAKGGSCSFLTGDLNAVVQKSTNYGKTFGPMVHISPNFPIGGADEAPIVIEPNGQLDVVFDAHLTNPKTFALAPAHFYFERSTDGGATWSKPVMLGSPSLTISDQEWWIDGDIGLDAGGDLYATWDTQGSSDIGWLAYSTDHGATWSSAIRVTPDTDKAVHIVQVAGTKPGEAVLAWQSDRGSNGYALYLRPYSVGKGWLAPTSQPSGNLYGVASLWPGDTFGISYMPSASTPAGHQMIDLSWGSGAIVGGLDRVDIYATTVLPPA